MTGIFCDSAQNESAVEAYYAEFKELQKDRMVKQMLSNRLADFDLRSFNHNFGRFIRNKIVR